MSIVNVALAGATGSLGAHILDAFVQDGSFKVTVLQRAKSKSTPAHQDKIRIEALSDGLPLDELTEQLRGQDALVVCYRAKDAAEQIKFGKAAAAAGVKRLIPADFGSCDSNGKRERELVTLFELKVQIRDSLQRLAEQHEGFSWTSLVNGHFFDWGLRENFLHFNLQEKKADIIDDGDKKSSQATLAQIAKATVRILQRPEETKNKMLFIQSFCVSQNDVLRSLEKASGAKWEVQRFDSEEFIKEKKSLADGGDRDAIEDLVFVLGALYGNWEEKPDFAMETLGLEDENLDDVVQSVVNELDA
ncbi:NAD(P)-binding protein [Cryphonectria parasitica EP155]|uniref:NAD(P)-binding protein n=1 Tax=Cryphonectria parasitica (strain ATCC 38755 / EP155) TaxID=660469 RepID=A0A9P4XYH2_CRYP1|nr:NAD(P)-binding protein [Cryphonectria parasitica EP155]KAF3763672.1 NAD(P)-binding protein [Cryphonectria parasitica EP155]